MMLRMLLVTTLILSCGTAPEDSSVRTSEDATLDETYTVSSLKGLFGLADCRGRSPLFIDNGVMKAFSSETIEERKAKVIVSCDLSSLTKWELRNLDKWARLFKLVDEEGKVPEKSKHHFQDSALRNLATIESSQLVLSDGEILKSVRVTLKVRSHIVEYGSFRERRPKYVTVPVEFRFPNDMAIRTLQHFDAEIQGHVRLSQ